MPSQQALESLKILQGGPSFRRQRPTEDYGFSGAVPTQGELSSPFELEQSDMADAADARDRAATQRIQATNAGIEEYNRPDVTAIRQEQEANALRKLILPAQVKGQYDVQAAKAHADAQAAQTAMLIGGRQQVAETNQGGQDARAAANAKAMALRQRLQALQTGKAHAARPGGIYDSLFGPQQKTLDQAEIADLMGQIGEEAAPETAAPTAAPAARPSAQDIIRRRLGR